MHNLKHGFLSGIAQRVKDDKDLDLQIRDNYLNIYYKGNSLLKLSEASHDRYRVDIHQKFLGGSPVPDLTCQDTAVVFLGRVPDLKENIIRFGSSSLELEYEQLIIRANNQERRNASEYFIVDRQYATGGKERFDLTGVFWDRNGRRRGQEVFPCLMEVKFALNTDIATVHQQLTRYYGGKQRSVKRGSGGRNHIPPEARFGTLRSTQKQDRGDEDPDVFRRH
jgi:hypothetical protein